MTTDTNSPAAFYCPVHQIRFHATPAEVIQCDQASHAVGYGFPHGHLWTFCCACSTFAPHEPSGHNSQLTECQVCEREVAKRCLCHSCQVLTIESVVLVHRKVHSIDGSGVKPSCPGCGSPPAEKVLQHDCPELGMSFLTARAACLFCELQIDPTDAAQHTEISGPLCNSCGAALVAPYRFCKKCGKPQSQTETYDIIQEAVSAPLDEPSEQSIDEAGTEWVEEPTGELEVTHNTTWDFSRAPLPPKRRTPWLIGGATALLSVAILIAVAVTRTNRTPSPSEPKTPEAPPGMVYIASGDFLMGNNAGDEYERPAHKVGVAPFYIDVTEVTCEEYLKFLTATARRDPANWTRQTCSPEAVRKPATGIDWNDAKAYADWANKRLPTEEEWEFAARSGGANYPWGNEWRSNAANAGDTSAGRLTDVASYPNGKTPAGVMDLIGNAWEWTSSDVVVYPGGSLSTPVPEDVKVVRGGSWQAGKQATSTYRGFLHITNAKDYSATGFRCVKDVGPSPSPTKP
jgi:formylglycine-generating enzyme required for sulfatase activity